MPLHEDYPAELARAMLEQQGFKCCPEPNWIPGKKPDFFCTGLTDIWVEVKSLAQTPSQRKDFELSSWFHKRSQIDRPGARVNVFYAPDANLTEKDVKEAVKRVLDLLKRGDYTTYQRLVVTVPCDPDYKKDIEFSIRINNQAILIISARSMAGRYGYPFIGTELRIGAEHLVKVRQAGLERNATARELGLDGQHLRLAVFVTPWEEHEISFSGSMELETPKIGWPDRERLLRDAQNAAKKFKDALRYRTAPSLILYVSEYDSPESCVIRIGSLAAMLYGMPTFVWSPEELENAMPSLIYGKGAFWANNKNRSVSAACYVSHRVPECLFHNPWAKEALPRGLLGCPEYKGLENGKIVRMQ
jgi:hypothetical protein